MKRSTLRRHIDDGRIVLEPHTINLSNPKQNRNRAHNHYAINAMVRRTIPSIQ